MAKESTAPIGRAAVSATPDFESEHARIHFKFPIPFKGVSLIYPPAEVP